MPTVPCSTLPSPIDGRLLMATSHPDDQTDNTHRMVRQLRLVVAAEDFDEAVAFYRDALGLPEQAAFEGAGDARVMILEAGRATLELANLAQKRMIDDAEAGGQESHRIRLAFEVDDTSIATEHLTSAGADLLAPPTVTPWRTVNSRMAAPAGLQITLFEELQDLESRKQGEGFGTSADR